MKTKVSDGPGKYIDKCPLVIILDIDGTVIGDITPQVVLYEIVNELKKQKERVPYDINTIVTKLQAGVIRPHFDVFVNELQKYGVEFFVYTASEKAWAEYIVKLIEKTHNIKVNRPLFTRNNCSFSGKDYVKSIKTIRPLILRTLRKKYKGLQLCQLKDNLMIIDNREVYNSKNDSRVILLCPTYSYAIPENIPAIIKPDVFANHAKMINEIMMKYNMIQKPVYNYLRFQKLFYERYIQDISHTISNSESQTDMFFERTKNAILQKNIKSFSPRVVSYLNQKCVSAVDVSKQHVKLIKS